MDGDCWSLRSSFLGDVLRDHHCSIDKDKGPTGFSIGHQR